MPQVGTAIGGFITSDPEITRRCNCPTCFLKDLPFHGIDKGFTLLEMSRGLVQDREAGTTVTFLNHQEPTVVVANHCGNGCMGSPSLRHESSSPLGAGALQGPNHSGAKALLQLESVAG
jgi:hypothetical protein